MSRHRTFALAVALCLALVAAGCGSDSEGADAVTASTADSSADGSTPAQVDLSGDVNDKGTEDISGDGATAEIDIEVDDDYFKPTFVQAEPGASVTVHLENEGENTHTFTLDGDAVDQNLEPGEDATVVVEVPEDGSLRFSCNFHSGMGMQGAFYTA